MSQYQSMVDDDKETLDTEQEEMSLQVPFAIPSLPRGQVLTLVIESNWGDDNFVGLNGIETFDAKTGLVARVERVSCSLTREDSPTRA